MPGPHTASGGRADGCLARPVSQIENGDLDLNEVAALSRYARALGARMRIIFDYGDDLRQIA
jgi:hypothetical protein